MGLDAYIYKVKESDYKEILKIIDEMNDLQNKLKSYEDKIKEKVNSEKFWDIVSDINLIRINLSDEDFKEFLPLYNRLNELENLKSKIDERTEELQYWRRNWNVHDYISENFNDNEEDNCVKIFLTKENVEQIIHAIDTGKLKDNYYDIKSEFKQIWNKFKDGYLIYYWAWY